MKWKPHSLKVRRCAECLIDPNEYLASFPADTLSDNIDATELNLILLKINPNSWSQQAYVQGFYCKYISFKSSGSMFEHMEIAESIYKVEVEPSY